MINTARFLHHSQVEAFRPRHLVLLLLLLLLLLQFAVDSSIFEGIRIGPQITGDFF